MHNMRALFATNENRCPITGFPLVLKSPEKVLILASVILKNQCTEFLNFFQ